MSLEYSDQKIFVKNILIPEQFQKLSSLYQGAWATPDIFM